MAAPTEIEFANRPRFRHSGRVDGLRFAIWAMVPLAGAAAVSALLGELHRRQVYVQLFAIPLAAAAVGWLTGVAVRQGRCRSWRVAVLFGTLVGLILIPGAYYFDFLATRGWTNAARFDLFLDRFGTRVEHDILWFIGPAPARRPSPAMTLLLIGFTIVLVQFTIHYHVCTTLAQPYCERSQTWMLQQTVTLARESRNPERLAAFQSLSKLPDLPLCEATIYYALSDAGRLDSPVYLEICEIDNPHARVKGPLLSGCIPLTVEEFFAVAKCFPALSELFAPPLTPRAEPLAGPEAAVAGFAGETVDATFPFLFWYREASVASREFYLLPGLLAAAPAALVAVGLALLAANFDPHRLAWATTGVILAALGGLGLLGVKEFTEHRLLRQIADKVRERTSPRVDPAAPGSLFVEYVLRERWSDRSPISAEDLGFVTVDVVGRRVLFEGDRQRWEIPAAAIRACIVEQRTKVPDPDADPRDAAQWVAIIVIDWDSHVRELPLMVLGSQRDWLSEKSSRRAEMLAERIEAILARPQPDDTRST